MIDFSGISEEDFNALADKGVIGPYRNDFVAIGAVIDDKKPLALVDEDMAMWATAHSYKYNLNLKASIIPSKELRTYDPRSCAVYAVYKSHITFNDLCVLERCCGTYNASEQVMFYDIALGRLLGYTETDIACFLRHNFGYRNMMRNFTNWRIEVLKTGEQCIVWNEDEPCLNGKTEDKELATKNCS